MIRELEKRAAEASEADETTLSVLEYVAQWTADGGTLIRLAREISESSGEQIEHGMISRYLRSEYGDEAYAEAMTDARRLGAFALTEAAIDDSEQPLYKDQVSAVRLRNDTRHWTAEKWNREAFGSQKGSVNVQLNLGMMHLDALRRRPVVRAEIVEESANESQSSVALARESDIATNVDMSASTAITPAIARVLVHSSR